MKSYKRWQVVLGVALFLMVMGIVGRIDRESAEALLAPMPGTGGLIYVAGQDVGR